MLAYPDASKQVIVMSDGSDVGCGLVISQVKQWNPETPIHEQDHELLVRMGGSFTGSALNWSVIEKLLRWSTKIVEYRYSIDHIEGVHNVWTDLISRWGGKPLPMARIHTAKRVIRHKRKRSDAGKTIGDSSNKATPLRPLDQDVFVWPTMDESSTLQAQYVVPQHAALNCDDLWRVNDLIWIHSESAEFVQRLMIIAHYGRHGHRGVNVMENHIRSVFVIDGLSRIVRDFCKKFLLCLHVKGGVVIPRPFSETHYTLERNSTLHWDFRTLGYSFGTSRYVLVMKDEATHFVDLVACDSPKSEVAASATLDWYSRFGVPNGWVSDSGSHFKNKVVAELNRRLKGRQEFVLAYAPWKMDQWKE
ncbi:hypothetical protein PHPALM_9442 [Phytophthora palmivora]|uniref:Integrase catalytic domain-containing protein n=1 Tax=Phytophthora palmivora TaxID=4796 RepID=A0A2P4Y797_9STRA|nr:hypothetical protein PHPALM_9442 [Phytophthora palmivora]